MVVSCDAKSWRARRRAFSLLELTIVMLIIGILAAIATPSFASLLSKYRADAAANRIVADLARTQSLAYSTSTSQTLSLTVASSSYQILGLRDLNKAASTYTVDLTAEPYKSTLTSANFGGTAQISYNGYGQPTSGGTIVLASGNQTRTITVDSSSGKGTIQ
jgi:prepilin-type N-terminal cleavage/methylation domain-containing protein